MSIVAAALALTEQFAARLATAAGGD